MPKCNDVGQEILSFNTHFLTLSGLKSGERYRILRNYIFNIFVLMSTKRTCQKILAIGNHLGKRGKNGIFIGYVESLCPSNYCIKHFSVSSSLLHQHSLERTLVQIAVVDMLWLYYAALGVALYLETRGPSSSSLKVFKIIIFNH